MAGFLSNQLVQSDFKNHSYNLPNLFILLFFSNFMATHITLKKKRSYKPKSAKVTLHDLILHKGLQICHKNEAIRNEFMN